MKLNPGQTPRLAQDAMVEELKQLFKGKKYAGPAGRELLNVYKQDVPIPEDNDEDADTEAAASPYVVVELTGGVINTPDEPQIVEMSLTICAFDTSTKRVGYQDVVNIKEDIVQRFCTMPYFGGAFTVNYPITWAMQRDDTHPYYYGAVLLNVTVPAMTSDTALEELV